MKKVPSLLAIALTFSLAGGHASADNFPGEKSGPAKVIAVALEQVEGFLEAVADSWQQIILERCARTGECEPTDLEHIKSK